MPKGRGTVVFLILAALAVILVLVLGRNRLSFLGKTKVDLPLDIQTIVPPDWQVLPELAKKCNYDSDPDQEWLVFYRYDQASVQKPYRKAGTQLTRGPIGATVYDTQATMPETGSGTPGPYRPTFLVPYRLLPDFYPGKGQGYLGESSIETIFYPAATTKDCRVDEIAILGYSDNELPDRVSIFRWQNTAQGYAGYHFAGSAWVDVEVPLTGSDPIQHVIVYDRLQNHRSLLCVAHGYERTGDALEFDVEPSEQTVDFCYGPPPDPLYPEGVVVAMLRGYNPTERQKDLGQPATRGFVASRNSPLFGVDLVAEGRPAIPILSVTNPGSVATQADGGAPCTGDQVLEEAPEKWWCGRETASVTTEIPIGGTTVRLVEWQLMSITAADTVGDVYWRVVGAVESARAP